MFQTGATQQEQQAIADFPRRLLSQYNPQWTLDSYCAYFALSALVDKCGAAATAATAAHKQGKDEAAPKKAADEAAAAFFALLKDSFARVRDHIQTMEAEAQAAVSRVRAGGADIDMLRHAEAKELREEQRARLVGAYVHIAKLRLYRHVNAEAFRRLFEKMMTGAAAGSLELQQKLRTADKIIFESPICTATFNTDRAKDVVVSMYSLIFHKSYEHTRDALRVELMRERDAQPRVLSLFDAHHYAEMQRHRFSQGTFAARLLTGTSNAELGRDVERLMGADAVKSQIGQFANGEVSVTFDEPLRGDDVFILESLYNAEGKSLSSIAMELLLLVQTAKQSSGARVTAVVPFLPYNNRTAEGTLIAELMEDMGVDGVVTVDMFREQAAGYFSKPVHNLSMRHEFVQYLHKHQIANLAPETEIVVVAADGDLLKRAKEFADELGRVSGRDIALATAMKSPKWLHENNSNGCSCASSGEYTKNSKDATTKQDNGVELIGSAAGRVCIMVDTVIDEGTKLTMVARALHELGAVSVWAVATHLLFSGDAPKLISESPIDLLVTSDSLNTTMQHLRDPKLAQKLRVLPMAPLLTSAIHRIHSDTAVHTKVLD